MDHPFGLGRLTQLAGMTLALSGPGVATALAQELYGASRPEAFGASGEAGRLAPAASRTPANRNDRGRRPAGRVA